VILSFLCLVLPADAARDLPTSSSFIRRGEAAVGHDRLECGMRLAAFKFAPDLPRLDPRTLYEALEVGARCSGMSVETAVATLRRPMAPAPEVGSMPRTDTSKREKYDGCREIYVGVDCPTLEDAIQEARWMPRSVCKRIHLPPGITYLNETIRLGRGDANLIVEGAADGSSWISGGVPISAAIANGDGGVRRHRVTQEAVLYEIPVTHPAITDVPGLFRLDPHVRYQRARWPNAGTNDGGSVKEWIKPEPKQGQQQFTFVDLTDPGNPTGIVKDDSAMGAYNTYVSGRGGICDDMWDTSYSSSYWCADRSAGGWAEVDFEFAKAGTLGLPVGLAYSTESEDEVGKRIASWSNATGAVLHARHSQGWFSNMWEVASHNTTAGELRFGRGGSQGGRSWCKCDQCTYVGSWCRRDGNGNVIDDRLIGGGWFVENVLEELDTPGEFFYVESNRTILLLLNATDTDKDSDMTLIVPNLATLIDINGADKIVLSNVGFRDARSTFLEKHGVPSGGDWSLYKGAAVQIANSIGTIVQSCTFSRCDGTAIILTDRTRQITIEDCAFEWLGESAMAAWGYTDEWDGRDGRQPRETFVRRNIVREIGLYQKQSSAWFQAKSCDNHITHNIFFNMPRAAININDGFGGGNVISNNLLFNTCRESGDHGPINTWDRQPFLWDAAGNYGYDTPPHLVTKNFIVANYGASQGIDNDDGSSFYHISENIMCGEGLKADYGGHDSIFSHNLVIVSPYDGQNCINVNHFKPLHQHKFQNNVCAILSCRGRDCDDLIGYTYASCSETSKFPVLLNNTYYTMNGNASLKCADNTYGIGRLQRKWKYELGSSAHFLPDDGHMVSWLFEKVQHLRRDGRTTLTS